MGAVGFIDRLLRPATDGGEHLGKPLMGGGVAGIKLKGPAVLGLAACAQQQASGNGGGGGIAGAATPVPPVKPDRKLIFTYYFYWYDATTGAHMTPDRDHLPASPQPTWRSAAWQGKQLRDMASAMTVARKSTVLASMVSSLADEASASPDSFKTTRRTLPIPR